MLDIDLKMAQRFLTNLDEEATSFTFQTFTDCKTEKGGRDLLAKTFQGSLEEVQDELIKYNNLGAGIYVCINATDGQGIKKENIKGVRAYYAEADGKIVTDWRVEPTFEVQSKNGRHSYWILKEHESVDIVEFERLQLQIAKAHGTDQAIKNVNRVLRVAGFFHLKDKKNPFKVAIVAENGGLYTSEDIKRLYPKEHKSVKTPVLEINSRRGVLLPSVTDYFSKSWAETPNNAEIIHSAANCKKNGFTLEECVEMFESKGEALDRNTSNQIQAVYKSKDYEVKPFFAKKGGKLEDTILNSKLYLNANSSSSTYWVVDKENLMYMEVAREIAHRVVGKKNLAEAVKAVIPTYSPEIKSIDFTNDLGYDCFNTYQAPEWLAKKFYLDVPLEPLYSMPKEYQTYFDHLFGEFPESYKYVLDWMSYSLKGKNITVLALVGTARGIGKSVFASIMRALHGDRNFEVCKQSILSKEFNTQLMNKTMVNMDEVSILKDSELESIKAYTNATTTVEGKGLDAQTVKLHANILLTNNQVGCLSGVKSQDDRQFSIPEITKIPLNQNKTIKIMEINRLWEDKILVDKLARFLYSRDISDFNPTINLKSPHYYNIIKSSRAEWNYLVLENLAVKHRNCAISFLQLKTLVKEKDGVQIGRAKFDSLCFEFPNVLATRYFNGTKMVFFAKENEDVTTFQVRVRECTVEDTKTFEILKFMKPLVD